MKFTLSWLKEYLETDASLTEITDRLTALGIEVEKITDRGEDLKAYVVGHVESCEQHPDADRLNVTMVDTGTEKLQVVCGAPNCRQGLKGVFAPSGAYVPGLDVTLKKTKIRGVESNGMLCSESELCLSEEHDGIIELPEDAEIGASAAKILGLDDPIVEIEVTPNRPDTTGIYGIARDLAASGFGTLKPLDQSPVKAAFDSPVKVTIEAEAVPSCPLFLGRTIKGVKNGPSPKWLRDQLTAIGLRPISALVDITNYMTIGYARPLHVYDQAKLKGDIHVALTEGGETLEALNDKTYTLTEGMTAICDDSGVLGLGGIIGGESSAVDEDTQDIYLECAWFNPAAIARTGRALMLDSDARYRFERGVDPKFTIEGMEIATRMILDICGGSAGDVVAAGTMPEDRAPVIYDPAQVKKLGGVDVDLSQQADILTALGFKLDQKSDQEWHVSAPSWRPDIAADGRADLVEEILRVYGYDKIETVSLPRPPVTSVTPLTVAQQRVAKLRRLMAGRGLLETVTWSFMDHDKAMLFGANDQAAEQLRLTNPISSELDQMRPSVLPNLLEAAQKNADKALANAAFFELGHIYQSAEAKGQKLLATGLRTGHAVPRHWATASRAVDFYDVKADVFAVCEAFGLDPAKLPVSTEVPDWYHPGRAASLRLGRTVLAHFGELHPETLQKLGIKTPAVGFEIFVEAIPVPKNKSTAFKAIELLPLQPLSRDFAFMVDQAVTGDQLIRAAGNADKNLITGVEVFDIYVRKGVEEGKKSVALSVTLQPRDETLTDKDIERISRQIVDTVSDKTGAVLRG
jgi:phenylalanyl-tRNA synthetase beta chain